MPPDAFASDPRLTPFEDAWDACVTAAERRAVEDRVRRELPDIAEEFLKWVVDATRIQAEEMAKRWRDTAPPERMDRAAEFRAQLARECGEPAVAHFNEVRAKLEAAESTEVLGPFDIVENFARWELRVADGVVYHLDDRLGSGGMAVAGKARRADNRDSAEWPRLMVCKIWGDEKVPGVVEALHHETELLTKSLSGPQVVRCLGSGVLRPVGGKSEAAAFHSLPASSAAPLQPGDRPCLLLGFTPGAVSLAELLATDRARWKNDPRLVLRFLSEVAKGFVHLHDTDSVAHGDVKPANFLVHLQTLLHPAEDSPVPVQLIDFGIAQRVLKARGGRASTRRAPDAYSPPEVMNQELFRASDLFGLGLTAVELITGCDIHAIHRALPALCNGLEPDGGGGLTMCALFDFILSQHDRPARNRLRLLRQPLESFFTATLAANHETRSSAAEAVTLLASLWDALARTYPSRPTSVPAHGAIRLGNPVVTEFFTSVGDFQADLERDFDREQLHPIPEVEVIYGFGGRGKSTQTARFWQLSAASGRYELVLWTNALSRERLELELATLLAEFDPAAAARKESPVAYFKSLLARCPNWLWVLNNCPDEAYGRDAEHDKLRPASSPERPASLTGWLADFLPPQGFGHLLITSRFDPEKFSTPLRAVWFNGIAPGRQQPPSPFPAGRLIPEMDQPTALGFLLRRAGWRQARPGEADLGGAEGWLREPRPAPRHNDPHAAGLSQVQLAHARELVGPRHLNCLPLALEFAGAHLGNERDLDFADYTRSFERRLTLLEKAFDPERHDPLGLLTITATYQPLIEHIAARHPEGAALLTLSAFLDPDLIPGELLLGDGLSWPDPALARLLSGETPRDRALALKSALQVLADASLIQLQVARRLPATEASPPMLTWTIHRVLQDVIRRFLTADQSSAWLRAVVRAGMSLFAGVDFRVDPRTLALGYRCFPSFVATQPGWEAEANHAPRVGELDTEAGAAPLPLVTVAAAWSSIGDYAIPTGNTRVAAQAYGHAKAIHQRLADSDPANAVWQGALYKSFTELGELAMRVGNPSEAARLHGEGLCIAQRLAESDPVKAEWQHHLLVAFTSLGRLVAAQGNLPEAQRLFGGALCIVQRLGESGLTYAALDHDVSRLFDSLGDLSVAQGNLSDAQQWFGESLRIAQRLAESDPTSATWQRDLSVSFEKLGELATAQRNLFEAQQLFGESLRIRLGLADSDPANAEWQCDLSVSFNKLGNLAKAQGNLSDAQEWFGESLRIRLRLVDSDPANTTWQRDLSVSWGRLGDLATIRGNLPEAQQFLGESLRITQRLAESNPANALWQRDLFVSFQKQAKCAKLRGQSAETLHWWRMAYEQLAGMKQRGILHPADEQHLQVARWKAAAG